VNNETNLKPNKYPESLLAQDFNMQSALLVKRGVLVLWSCACCVSSLSLVMILQYTVCLHKQSYQCSASLSRRGSRLPCSFLKFQCCWVVIFLSIGHSTQQAFSCPDEQPGWHRVLSAIYSEQTLYSIAQHSTVCMGKGIDTVITGIVEIV
jgi:hypothetical protein